MPDGLRLHSFPVTAAMLLAILLVRYLAFAGTAYWAFYRRGYGKLRKIRPERPLPRVVRREVLWSLATSVIFALSGAWLLHAWAEGRTRLYGDVAQWGWPWLLASVPVMTLIHETYFYWTHRWIHRPRLFRWVHKIHHDSHNPTPWAAFSFHPLEGILQAAILPLLVFLIPIHYGALLAYLMVMTVFSVINHTGFEIYPRNFERTFLGRLMITATHHFLHHHRGRGNYGLYFTFWDRWCGTQHHDSEAFYRSVTRRNSPASMPLGAEDFPPAA